MRIDRGKLAAILRTRDITQTQLAERARLSRMTISNVLCGRSCSIESAQRIAEALQIPVDDITVARMEA